MSKAEQSVAPLETEIFPALSRHEHEMVLHCHDRATGLKAIIAIHNTTLGPAMGGLRMWPYASEAQALTDVLRLSRGMTLKNALAGLNIGGGKAVIIGDPRSQKNEALLRRFGRFLNNLNGKYYTAEDVGMTEADMYYISMETDFVVGTATEVGGSGNPSPVTAYGVYLGIKASMKTLTGSDSLNGKSVMVQGVGAVGSQLVQHLRKEHAKVYVFDIFEENYKHLAGDPGVEVVGQEDVYRLPVDVFAPCALGGVLNPHTIGQLQCAIVAGAANNQLLDEERDARLLQQKGILYAPDFMVNAGGIINVSLELGTYNRNMAMKLTERIYDTTQKIFKLAEEKGTTTHHTALTLAEERIQKVGHNLLYL